MKTLETQRERFRAKLDKALSEPKTPKAQATLLWTHDEPWGIYVRGHVDQSQFAKAVLAFLETDQFSRDETQEWLWDYGESDDPDEAEDRFNVRKVKAIADHRYIRKAGKDTELGQMWELCELADHGCKAVTIVLY